MYTVPHGETVFQATVQEGISVKDQIIHIFGFVDHMVFVAATQVCHLSAKAVIDQRINK